MGNYTAAATIGVMLIVVLAFVGIAGYLVVAVPDGHNTGLILGALISTFSAIGIHLFGALNARPPQ